MVKMYDAKLTEIEKAAQAGLVATAKEVLKAARKLVPVDDGGLRRSGKVTPGFKEVTVRFHGPHAWLQHERLDYEHPNGGQAKFLEAAVEQVGAAEMVSDKIRARLR